MMDHDNTPVFTEVDGVITVQWPKGFPADSVEVAWDLLADLVERANPDKDVRIR